MCQAHAFGTIWKARTSSCLAIPTFLYLHKQARARKKQPSCNWPERLPTVVFSGVLGFGPFVFVFCIFNCICCCMFVFVRPVWVFLIVFVFSFARVSELIFFYVCVCVRARLNIYCCISGCNCWWRSRPPRERQRRSSDCSVQTCTQR